MFPSQFWKHKDHETLIRAMSILKHRGRRDVTLVLCGLPKDTRDLAHGDRILRLIRDNGLSDQIRVASSAASTGGSDGPMSWRS